MNYDTDIAPRLGAGMSAAAIAAELTAERRAAPENYRPVKRAGISAWLATDGLQYRIETWRDDPSHVESPAYGVLYSAFAALLAVRTTPDASLAVGPGGADQALLDLAVSEGVLTADDVTRITGMAYVGADVTTAQVDAAIADHQSLAQRWQRAVRAGATLVEADAGDLTWNDLIAAVEATT